MSDRKEIHIWYTGYRASGEDSPPRYEATYTAENFDQAMQMYMADHPDYPITIGQMYAPRNADGIMPLVNVYGAGGWGGYVQEDHK